MRVVVIATCALLSACGGSARQIVHDDDGGLLALEGDSGQAHADAERQMNEHCGTRGHRIVVEGDVEVAEEETHERSRADRTAQAQTAMGGDHTSWVEGQPAYAESGVSVDLDGDVQLYDRERGARARSTRMRTERHIEYECVEMATSGGEDAP